jgi:hypothetical protein
MEDMSEFEAQINDAAKCENCGDSEIAATFLVDPRDMNSQSMIVCRECAVALMAPIAFSLFRSQVERLAQSTLGPDELNAILDQWVALIADGFGFAIWEELDGNDPELADIAHEAAVQEHRGPTLGYW